MMAITLIILSTLLSSSLSFPIVKTWTLGELSIAIELHLHPNLQRHLENALNTIMLATFSGKEQDVSAVLLSPSGQREWTRVELINASSSSSTNPNYKFFITNALQELRDIDPNDGHIDTMKVIILAMDISVWTPQDVDEVKLKPNLPADVSALLKKVEKLLKTAMDAGTPKKTMAVTLIILSTLLSSSLSFPLVKTWTLNEISTALELQTHPDLRSHLENALNTIMFAMFTESEQDVLAVLQSPSGQREWTRVELIKAAHNSSTNPNYKPFIKNALQYLKNIEHKDVYDDDTIEVTIPAMDISVWTPQDVDEAKLDPNLPADVWDLLKKVDKSLKNAMEAGTPKDKVTATLVTPVGIVPSNGEKREIISSKKAETKSE